MVPDADVADRGLILTQRRRGVFRFTGMKSHVDLIQAVGKTCECDIVSQERSLQFELVRLDEKALNTPRNNLKRSQQNDRIADDAEQRGARGAGHGSPD